MIHAVTNSARHLYAELFNEFALQQIYEEKIALSFAIGLDGTDQRAFRQNLEREIRIILRKVANRSYQFTPYKQKLISKGPNSFPRVISIPTIRDRLTLRVVNDILSGVYAEAHTRRPHTYIKKIRERLRDATDDMAFTRVDIADFYPNIDHKILLAKLRRKIRKAELVRLIRTAISTPTESHKSANKGVPQGLRISNILASIYLHQLDAKMNEKYTYFRYVDDILVICKDVEAENVYEDIRVAIRKLKLKCHELGKPAKSQVAYE